MPKETPQHSPHASPVAMDLEDLARRWLAERLLALFDGNAAGGAMGITLEEFVRREAAGPDPLRGARHLVALFDEDRAGLLTD